MERIHRAQLQQELSELDELVQATIRKAIRIWQCASPNDISYRELDAINQLACACRAYKGMRERRCQ